MNQDAPHRNVCAWTECMPLHVWRMVLQFVEFPEVLSLCVTNRFFYYRVLPLCDSIFISSRPEQHDVSWWKEFSLYRGANLPAEDRIWRQSERAKRALRAVLSKLGGSSVHTIHIEDCRGLGDVVEELASLSTRRHGQTPTLAAANTTEAESTSRNQKEGGGSLEHVCLMRMDKMIWKQRALHRKFVDALNPSHVNAFIVRFSEEDVESEVGQFPLYPELASKLAKHIRYFWYDAVHMTECMLKTYFSTHDEHAAAVSAEMQAQDLETLSTSSSSESERSDPEKRLFRDAQCMENLLSLGINVSHTSEVVLRHNHLKQLCLHWSMILNHVDMQLPKLEFLAVDFFRVVPDNFFTTLQQFCANIKEIRLSCCLASNQRDITIERFPFLERLTLKNCRFFSRLFIRDLPKLESLNLKLNHSLVSASLERLPSLREMFLSLLGRCTSVSGSNIHHNLENVEVLGCPMLQLAANDLAHELGLSDSSVVSIRDVSGGSNLSQRMARLERSIPEN